MKVETITCDCCERILQPKRYLQLHISCKGYGEISGIPDDILFDDICQECVKAIYLAINDVSQQRMSNK